MAREAYREHCPVTGHLLMACECGACDDLDDDEPQDGSDEEEQP